MNPNRFDRITKLFADRKLSRRAAVAEGSATLATGALAAAAGTTATRGQDATPPISG